MCTVTYINRGGIRYFTSNRDENKKRPVPLKLEKQLVNDIEIIYPKDPVAGGSWFAVSNKPTVAVLLNGAFKKHSPVYPYQKSRGVVLLDLIAGNNCKNNFEEMLLTGVEPFTIIYAGENCLAELRWDAEKKYFSNLDIDGSYIWSSVTLYDEDVAAKRKQLFHQFLSAEQIINEAAIRSFHQYNHNDYENGFIIDRTNGIKTQSVTQAMLTDAHIHFIYHDLLTGTTDQQQIRLNPVAL